MSTLLMPDGCAPSNLHLTPTSKVRFVENDIFDIANRLRREVSPRLHVIELEQGGRHNFVVMEHCDDGVERRVWKYEVLDGRVVEHCRYMLNVPLAERVRLAEAENAKHEADVRAAEEEQLYEDMGRAMHRELYTCGFSANRPVSYPARGIKPRRS